MIYPQPDRELLKEHMSLIKKYVTGNVIDVGGGSDRYKKLYKYSSWVNANVSKNKNVHLFIDLNKSNPHFVNRKYDTVICNQVLGDVKDPSFSVNELVNLLEVGGFVIITESLLNEEHDPPHDYFRFTQYAIRHLLTGDNPDLEVVLFKKRGKFFSTMFQFINRILINRFQVGASSNKIVKILFYLFLKLNTKVALLLDGFVKHKCYNSFYLGWIIVARKMK